MSDKLTRELGDKVAERGYKLAALPPFLPPSSPPPPRPSSLPPILKGTGEKLIEPLQMLFHSFSSFALPTSHKALPPSASRRPRAPHSMASHKPQQLRRPRPRAAHTMASHKPQQLRRPRPRAALAHAAGMCSRKQGRPRLGYAGWASALENALPRPIF